MARLPQPGSDDGVWGDVLNSFLAESHNSDGTIKPGAVSSAGLQDSSIVTGKLQDGAVTSTKLSSVSPSTGDALVYDGSVAGGLKWQAITGGGGASGAPTGAAGGDLAGTYPNPTVPALATKEPVIAAGTTTQYYRGDKTWQTLDKSKVGLANVDNTSDASKPVSTAQASAIAAKATDSAVVHVTGDETVAGIKTFSASPVVPDASFAIAKTTGLQTALNAKADASAVGAKVIVLGPSDPVPGGTAAGTVIVRTTT